jgi:hypothetical protein
MDVLAESSYDAAHLFVVEAKQERQVGLPKPTLATVFEVVTGGKVYRVAGAALQRWIVERRENWNGPKGYPQPLRHVRKETLTIPHRARPHCTSRSG